jgi:hypothetical protein
MASYFLPRLQFHLPKLALHSSTGTFRSHALEMTFSWMVVLVFACLLGGTIYVAYQDSFAIKVLSSSFVAIGVGMYVWFLRDTWVDDGRHDKHDEH